MKTSIFTVRATEAQSICWKQAADAEGHRSAGTWLAAAADAYLKVRARAGRPIPLLGGVLRETISSGPLLWLGRGTPSPLIEGRVRQI